MTEYAFVKKTYLEARKARNTVAIGLLSVIITDIEERMRPGKGQFADVDAATRAAVKAARKKHAQALEFGSTDKLVAEGLVLDSLPKQEAPGPAEIMMKINELIEADIPTKVLVGATMKAFEGNADAATVRKLVAELST